MGEQHKRRQIEKNDRKKYKSNKDYKKQQKWGEKLQKGDILQRNKKIHEYQQRLQ